MDMENEVEDFSRTGTPSLVGQSIRGEMRPESVNSRGSSRPNIKVSKSPEESTVSLEQLHQEGVLLQDEEELDSILDEEGHIKDAALDISAQEGDAEVKPPSNIDVKSINEHEEGDSFLAKDEEFIAPASSRDGSKSRSSSVTPNTYNRRSGSTKPLKTSPLVHKIEETPEPTIKDVVNEYNEGNYHPFNSEEEQEERQPRRPTRNIPEDDVQIPDYAKAIDAENTVPAGAREGSDSPYISSPARSITSNSNGEYVKSPQRPHLARGDSYQNTVTNNDFSNTPPLNIGERRSRGSNRSESSLNYLRSISRSRSRVANDKKAIGEDRGTDEAELKEEGALLGDHYDQAPDLEDAVEKALGLVQSEMKNLGFEHADIPEEVEEEELKVEEKEPEVEAPEAVEAEGVETDVAEDDSAKEEPKAETDAEVTETEAPEAEADEPKEVESEEKTSEVEAETPEAEAETPEAEDEKKAEDEKEVEPVKEPEAVSAEVETPEESEEEEEPEPELTEPAKKGADGSVFVPKASDKMTYEDEPVYLYTSLAGGRDINSRTQRLITILTANDIKFSYRDLGTDAEAKKIWRRYCGGKTLPGIVRGVDDFIGNWEDVEEANEDYAVRSFIYETA